MHNGFVRVNEEKMSKSLGNFFTVREVLKQYKPEIIRFFILSSHYRSPLNYSDEQLNDASAALTRLYTALRDCTIVNSDIDVEYKVRFEEAMNDDFNTPVAVSVLFDLARELNKAKEADINRSHCLSYTLIQLASLLGLLQDDPEKFLKSGVIDNADITDDFVEQQIRTRLEAKQAKNWLLADEIRDALKGQGVILEDAPNGLTSWRRE
jgi:cysteinyl-tRNA synthetase